MNNELACELNITFNETIISPFLALATTSIFVYARSEKNDNIRMTTQVVVVVQYSSSA